MFFQNYFALWIVTKGSTGLFFHEAIDFIFSSNNILILALKTLIQRIWTLEWKALNG